MKIVFTEFAKWFDGVCLNRLRFDSKLSEPIPERPQGAEGVLENYEFLCDQDVMPAPDPDA